MDAYTSLTDPLEPSLMIMMQFEPLNRKWMALSDFIMSQV